jgi:hypothetical protein
MAEYNKKSPADSTEGKIIRGGIVGAVVLAVWSLFTKKQNAAGCISAVVGLFLLMIILFVLLGLVMTVFWA